MRKYLIYFNGLLCFLVYGEKKAKNTVDGVEWIGYFAALRTTEAKTDFGSEPLASSDH